VTSKHTPAPWRVTDNSWEISTVYNRSGDPVAECHINPDVTEETQDIFERQKDANARLIASAPDMFDTLTDLEEYLADCADADIEGGNTEMRLLMQVREVLAKATGRSND